MADAKVFMNATDIILDLKTQLCDKRGINDLSTRCALTDLIYAAVNAGRVEAYEEIKNSHDYDQGTLQKKIEKLKDLIAE